MEINKLKKHLFHLCCLSALIIVFALALWESPSLFRIDNIITKQAYSPKSDKININTASLNELIMLSGIGEAKATEIIEYREKNGRFKYISDIKNVKGISDKIFEEIKDKIEV